MVRCAFEINAVKRNNMVNSFFIVSIYKPNAAFWALKTDVISACDNAAL